MLQKRGIKHEVLNAKFHEREAEIVALAGQHGAVTIATNMAGQMCIRDRHHNSGGQMGNTDCGGCLIDMLSAGTAGTVRIHTQVVWINLDINLILNIRHNIAGYK